MPSILFVCAANQFRSPIAAACLLKGIGNENGNQQWIVGSAGTWTESGMPLPKLSLQVASQLGLHGLERHRTRSINQKILEDADLILVMEAGHKEAISIEFPAVRDRIYLLSELVEGIAYDVPDPANLNVDPQDVGRALDTLIVKGKGKILERADSLSRLRSS